LECLESSHPGISSVLQKRVPYATGFLLNFWLNSVLFLHLKSVKVFTVYAFIYFSWLAILKNAVICY